MKSHPNSAGMLSANSPSRPHPLEQRRQEALAVAKQCEAILRDRFQAERVILFGSLAGESPWHQNSDLDLAVAGLSHADWLQAYDELEAIAPTWLKIDLVRLESLYPEVRARILKEKPMPNNPYLALKERLHDELVALEKTASALESALERSDIVPEDFVIRTLASYINDFYRRCERISERVAVSLDGGLPQGENWHQALLSQVADPGGNERPPLWSGSLLLDLNEYRKFRHIVHHKYGDELRVDYVIALAELAPAVLVKVREAITTFSSWLEQKASSDRS